MMVKNLLAFVFGGVFAVGLMVSGMANPAKVVAFLDIFGAWDASLAFVMAGAIAVAFLPFQKAVRSRAPITVFNEAIDLPKSNVIDQPLMMGSAMFGIGWGIAGMCPAPSLTLIGLGHYEAGYFIVAMVLGVWLHRKYSNS